MPLPVEPYAKTVTLYPSDETTYIDNLVDQAINAQLIIHLFLLTFWVQHMIEFERLPTVRSLSVEPDTRLVLLAQAEVDDFDLAVLADHHLRDRAQLRVEELAQHGVQLREVRLAERLVEDLRIDLLYRRWLPPCELPA